MDILYKLLIILITYPLPTNFQEEAKIVFLSVEWFIFICIDCKVLIAFRFEGPPLLISYSMPHVISVPSGPTHQKKIYSAYLMHLDISGINQKTNYLNFYLERTLIIDLYYLIINFNISYYKGRRKKNNC